MAELSVSLASYITLLSVCFLGLIDQQSKVRCICALALAALAEAASPYGTASYVLNFPEFANFSPFVPRVFAGIESFDSVLRPLWEGIRQHRGKTLAAFLKAIGFIIPLMDASYANYYTKEVRSLKIPTFCFPSSSVTCRLNNVVS